MVLTEEQRQRMEENRKRALEIKRKKQLEKEKEQSNIFDAGGFIVGNSSHEEITESSSQNKKRRMDNNEGLGDGIAGGWDKKGSNNKEDETTKSNGNNNSTSTKQSESDNDDDDDDTESLEEFELNSSPYISQTEAQRQYCIPKGTLDVCSYVEKDNPHKKGWSKMKLYHRSEVRKRAYKRFGGKEGLILEREKRRKKRSEKDMNDVKNVFG